MRVKVRLLVCPIVARMVAFRVVLVRPTVVTSGRLLSILLRRKYNRVASCRSRGAVITLWAELS